MPPCLLASSPSPRHPVSPSPTSPSPLREMVGTMGLPVLAGVLAVLAGPLGWGIEPVIVQSALILAALPVAKRAWEGIVTEGKPNVDFLDFSALAIVTSLGESLAGASMVTLIQLGEHLRARTARSASHHVQQLLATLAQFAWVERDGQKHHLPIAEVQPDDTVIVYPGEMIPVDGTILRGSALIDEQKLTGESVPVVRAVGETVYASTGVREGEIYICTEKVGATTRAGRTIELIQNAPVHDTRVENYAAKIGDRAVIPTLLLGGAVFAFTGSAARAASVLTIDFATGIRVSVPTTVMASLSYAASRGIVIRSGRAIEQLAKADAIVFDKTGTLTQGNIAICGIKTPVGVSEKRLLQLAAAAEQRIIHPVADAIMRHAQYHELTIPPRGEWEYEVGLGIRANIEGGAVLVGSDRFLRQENIDLEPLYHQHPRLQEEKIPAIYVANNGQILGVIQYTDPLRPESHQVVDILSSLRGASIHLLTGDNWHRARVVAAQLNIPEPNIHAEAFPEQKAKVIQKLHEEGKTVAFVGDGLNDSAALAYADVSVSFRDGSEVARETADVVLMRNDLWGLVEAVSIARNARDIIYQNAGIVAVPNLTGLALAATVGISPMVATALNNGSGAIASLNGLRPLLGGLVAGATDSRGATHRGRSLLVAPTSYQLNETME
ncbi:heavy metal translocating P-type ATPase [[Phormidium] sp. ETS-05]|uniref:heavy metal translocating P-type ATPase n=1 Tax=[Phormidium] sp. ETS-05 TaxID=222819 RepID=UPI001E32E5C6|nr:heavy metal translocating P-type ATPase [[Phormidium] sp. ETS-05]